MESSIAYPPYYSRLGTCDKMKLKQRIIYATVAPSVLFILSMVCSSNQNHVIYGINIILFSTGCDQ